MSKWPEPTEVLNLTTKQCTEILKEVWGLLEIRDDDLFDCLNRDGPHNHAAVDARLQKILEVVTMYPSDVLCTWLRYTCSRKKHFPTWNPLLEATVKQCRQRNSEEFTAMLFHGLIPGSKAYDYNTREE